MKENEDAKMLMGESAQKEMGLRISKLRESQHLSQQDLADLLGKKTRRETIKQWENAERHIKAEDIFMLSRFFGVSADYLLGLSDCPSRKDDEQIAAITCGIDINSIKSLKIASEMYGKENGDLINQILNRLNTSTILKLISDAQQKEIDYSNQILTSKVPLPKERLEHIRYEFRHNVRDIEDGIQEEVEHLCGFNKLQELIKSKLEEASDNAD